MIQAEQVLTLHEETVAQWHNEPISNPHQSPLRLVCEQHSYNYQLWHEEDIARSRDVTDAEIARVKRNIDGFNQKRNDCIERIDDWISAWLHGEGCDLAIDGPLNSETPGSMIDRLSILALRIYHLREQLDRDDVDEDHRASVQRKLAVCHEQRLDLARCLDVQLADVRAGRKRHKTYRQFKMYNDPTLNPYLYGAVSRKAG
jgi:hypothetical protein